MLTKLEIPTFDFENLKIKWSSCEATTEKIGPRNHFHSKVSIFVILSIVTLINRSVVFWRPYQKLLRCKSSASLKKYCHNYNYICFVVCESARADDGKGHDDGQLIS